MLDQKQKCISPEVLNLYLKMSDRNSNQIFNHEELEAELQRAREEKAEDDNIMFKKSNHSLDSDEEDDEETAKKYNVLDPNELEGQEEGTIDFDGEIKITPFNMKEELEEGYFDKEGTYIFNREADVIKDQWLDDIDWVKVKAREGTKRKQNDSESDEDLPSVNLAEHYKKMLELMKPGETVQKSICRLGGSSSSSRSASNRWKKKKSKEQTADEEADSEQYEKFQMLTRLADDIIQSGNMDVYEQTYEKLAFHVNLKCDIGKPGQTFDNSDGLDMFGDDFEEKVDETKVLKEAAPGTPPPSSANDDEDDELMWEFKWDSSDDSKVYGPFPTSQMLQWVNDQYFENGVLVRQCHKQDSEFHNSKRIDFELFL